MANRFTALTPHVLALLRIVTAFLLIQHGTAKFFHHPHVAMFDAFQPLSLIGVAGVLELVGGGLVLIGLFTRPAAFVLSGFMAVAYFMAHASKGGVLTPIVNGGELAILFSFVFLLLSVTGPGRWSLDAARRGRSSRSP